MGMSTNVAGFKPADQKWRDMKAIWDACSAAGVTPPDVVRKFFGLAEPDLAGVRVSEKALRDAGAVTGWDAEMEEGVEINVRNLPPDVTVVRVWNSY